MKKFELTDEEITAIKKSMTDILRSKTANTKDKLEASEIIAILEGAFDNEFKN